VPNAALVQRELAEKYYADNLGAKAAEQYGKYIKNPNHFAQDEVRYVQLLFFGEKYQESLDLATSLVNKLNPTDSKVFYMKRMQLYNLVQLQKWAEAVEAGKVFFANAVPHGSNYEVRDYTDYGQALQNAGMPAEAITAYEKALQINPNNVDLIRFMGDSYADNEDFVKAAEYYQRLVDSGNNKSNDLFTLSNYYLGIASTEGIDAATAADALAKSQKYIDEVDKLVPENVQIVNQKAKIAKFREGDTNNGAALAAYNELLSILDKKEDKASYARYFKYAYNYLATYYFTKGDKATAKTYYQKWLEYDPENEQLRNYVNSMK
jgi:tetratricopeptide (TPR) repeat protein